MKTKVNRLKNTVRLTAIAMCILVIFSCGNYLTKAPENNGTPNISMTVQADYDVSFHMAGEGTVIIDWGDGTIEIKRLRVFKSGDWFSMRKFLFAHSYSDTSAHMIKINSNNITHLTTGTTNKGVWTNVSNLTRLDVSGATALKWLNCANNSLTELDVSFNTALKGLDCRGNKLTKLDISKNKELNDLDCCNNQLTSLDLSENVVLMNLECYDNQLMSLDIRKNIRLISLYCANNQLTELNVSKNIALQELSCVNNQLTNLDLITNTILRNLDCSSNNLSAAALNVLFETLHNNPGNRNFRYKIVSIGNNHGRYDCNKSIAERKGWKVYY